MMTIDLPDGTGAGPRVPCHQPPAPALRRATLHDAAAIIDITTAAYAPWIPVIGREPGPMGDDVPALLADPDVEVWLADATGPAVGTASAPGGLVILMPDTDHLLLHSIAVAPSAQGTGLGGQLLAFTEARAAELKLPEVRLYTHVLMARNVAIYARHGYVETGRRIDNGFSRVFMTKRIG
ncbi:GNAT family N-acetyltransferase [Tistrella mobilis]|uniref:GNAT family N-acetyltransferase n=1 Tax=Tistrella mobilis TaxID=171437 RepID=UPI0031F673F5